MKNDSKAAENSGIHVLFHDGYVRGSDIIVIQVETIMEREKIHNKTEVLSGFVFHNFGSGSRPILGFIER